MSSYYKPKTKKICHTDYRKYIVPRDCDEVVVISQEDEWNCYTFVDDQPTTFLYLDTNHPLVNAGEAYWLNKTQLCTGYTIGNVFRPVFNYSKEKKSPSKLENILPNSQKYTQHTLVVIYINKN